MAYVLTYQLKFKNKLSESWEVDLSEQDGAATSVEQLVAQNPSVTLQYNSDGDQGKYDCIISLSATINLWINSSATLNHLTFIQATYEKWRVQIRQDGVAVFDGYLIPENGSISLKDKPYVISLQATDGLGLLKNYPLTDVTGLRFDGRNSIISYVAGALAKNILGLPVRVYCNIYESTMNDRAIAIHRDAFQQAKIHHRTFLKEDGEFVSCYDALDTILKGHFRLYYEAGGWVIYRIPEYTQVSEVYYTDYDGGIPQAGFLEDTTVIPIGRTQLIKAINRDAVLSNEIAIKTARHNYTYQIPVDLVNNQKLNRLGSFIAPLSGIGYAAYQLVGWTQKSGTLAGPGMFPVTAVNAYIKIETNIYGVETDRYYVLEHDNATNAYPLDNFIINDNSDFWVEKGDHLGVSVETRMKNGQTAPPDNHECLLVAILKDGATGGSLSDWYTLNPNGFWATNGANIHRDISGSVDETEWETISVGDNGVIPVNGRVYIWLGAGGVDSGNEAHFRNLQLNYSPMVRGSLAIVKGDYWTRSQTDLFVDSKEEEVFISDSPGKRNFRGALWEESGEVLTTPTWYRYGRTEARHYKELVNMGYFAHYYRRFLSIQGTFKGLKANNGTTEVPLSLSKRYYFVDDVSVQRNFILVPPVQIDVSQGTFSAKFIEVYKDDSDVTEEGDSSSFNYSF
jgi:hypothetical protein